jgi:regulatory protein
MSAGSHDVDEVFARTAKYCAIRERCVSQVRKKMIQWNVPAVFFDGIIDRLSKGNYINETRFAREYSRGQFRQNKWGRLKIINGLRNLNISEKHINEGLEEIDENAYKRVLATLISKKISQIKSDEKLAVLKKVVTFAIGKGYEPDLVWEEVQKALKEEPQV